MASAAAPGLLLTTTAARIKAFDIGANLLDPMFQGVYQGKPRHLPDLEHVLQRARDAGVERVMCTAGTVEDSRSAAALARRHGLRSTCGIHPTESNRAPADWASQLASLAAQAPDVVVAVGECGLDADRVEFSPMETQRKVFERHFELCASTRLPMFVHSRGCHQETIATLARRRHDLSGAVVHSFDGSLDEMRAIVELGIFVGINGCSLRTQASIDVAAQIPVEYLVVESDAPWCGLKPTHASAPFVRLWPSAPSVKKEKLAGQEGLCMVKDRNEPAAVLSTLSVLASVRGVDVQDLAQAVWDNSNRLFRW
jgi:TatD DNase family protein